MNIFSATTLLLISTTISEVGAKQLRGEGLPTPAERAELRRLDQGFNPRDPSGSLPSSSSRSSPPTSASPTQFPTTFPPTGTPTQMATTPAPVTNSPTPNPTTLSPTEAPTTTSPTQAPTVAPTTRAPTDPPTRSPTMSPTETPFYLAFVTDIPFQGNLDGLEGADSRCQVSAHFAGLDGTFKAWLSTADGTSPSNRFDIDPTLPFRLVDGTTIANNWDDLLDGNLLAPITVNEYGEVVYFPPIPQPGYYAWTATGIHGQAGDDGNTIDDCEGWTSNSFTAFGDAGHIQSYNEAWTEFHIRFFCSTSQRLFCFQQRN